MENSRNHFLFGPSPPRHSPHRTFRPRWRGVVLAGQTLLRAGSYGYGRETVCVGQEIHARTRMFQQ